MAREAEAGATGSSRAAREPNGGPRSSAEVDADLAGVSRPHAGAGPGAGARGVDRAARDLEAHGLPRLSLFDL